MKFVSKNLNLCIVLQSSLPAVTLAGGGMISPAKPGIYARFVDGIFSTDDQSKIDALLAHSSYNFDFVSVDNVEQASVINNARTGSSEPEHDIMDIQYGHPGKQMNPRPAVKLTPEMQAFLTQMAAKMATDMYKKMVDDGKLVPSVPVVQEVEKTVMPQPSVNLTQAPAPIEDDSLESKVDLDLDTEPGVELKPRPKSPGRPKKIIATV